MRSRYTAFALGETAYLLETWHPDFRPYQLEPDDQLRWIGLEIIDFDQQAGRASVEFEARWLAAGRVEALRECSDFLLCEGRWLYTDGRQLQPATKPWKPARNEICPCGSGARFKRCCGRGPVASSG